MAGTAKRTMVIAEDEEGVRESLTLIFGKVFQVFCAKHGEEALSVVKRAKPDIVILDIKMPKLDGLEVLRRLKARRFSKPIIMLTAYQSVEIAKEAIKLGARDYVPKPFTRDQIERAVTDALT